MNIRMTKPFGLNELSKIPDNWEIKGPDFIGIGCGKSGTSWWYQLLIEHPQVVSNRLNSKELSYFYHFGINGINKNQKEIYKKAFASPSNCICGEWSPGYLYYPLSIKYIAETCPNTKLIVLLRNPIDRTISALNQLCNQRLKHMNLTKDKEYLIKTFSFLPEAFYYSFVYQSLTNLLLYFSRKQLLIIQYEKCIINPKNEIAKTFSFLDVSKDFIPKSLFKEINKTKERAHTLTDTIRKDLSFYFRNEVLNLCSLFPEIDINLWEDFKNL